MVQILQSNTNGSPSANNTLTMMTETKPIERKGWRSGQSIAGAVWLVPVPPWMGSTPFWRTVELRH